MHATHVARHELSRVYATCCAQIRRKQHSINATHVALCNSAAMQQHLTTGDIAQAQNVHRSTVHRWIAAGILTADIEIAGVRLVSSNEYARFVEERRIK